MFTNYLNGDVSPVIATGKSTLQSDGSIISWLSEGLHSLQLNVPFQAFTPIDPIRNVSIGDLTLKFDAEEPWTPAAESNTIQASIRKPFFRLPPAPINDSLELPFGFNLSIGEIQNDFMITKNGNPVAGLSTVKLNLYQ